MASPRRKYTSFPATFPDARRRVLAFESGDEGTYNDGSGDFTVPPYSSRVTSAGSVSMVKDGNWQLAAGHYFDAAAADPAFALHVIYPRPDAETNTYARHRWAYPGIKYEIPIGVQFGAWPYRYEMISGPSWLNIEIETLVPAGDVKVARPGYGILSGTAPASPAAAENVTVRVTDQEGSTIDVTFSVEVNTSGFVFLDPVNGDDATATGLIDAPYKEVSTLQDSLPGPKVCYVRDTTGLADGYKPNPPRQFRVGTNVPNEPHAYVGYPGETVVVNCADQSGFGNASGDVEDTFFADIEIKDANRTAQTADNVRVIQRVSSPTSRETLWRLTCRNQFAGDVAGDNHGFILYMSVTGSTDDGFGHHYLYCSECVGDELNPENLGTNGASMWQSYQSIRALVERNVVKNSAVNNNGFFDFKQSDKHGEFRLNDTTENNQGTRHLRALASSQRGFPQYQLYRHNFIGDQVVSGEIGIGSADTLENRDSPSHGPIILARNSASGDIITPNADPLEGDYRAHGNVVRSVAAAMPTASGNVEGDPAVIFDANMKLKDAARAANLGTAGAEVAR